MKSPPLRFSPTAWAKLLFLRDLGPTEVGGFAITRADDPLYVEELAVLPQECTVASVCFDDAGVAEFFERMVDAGRHPQQFGRIWWHTHPGNSPTPSQTDELTFARVFGECDWAVMFILARDDSCYARVRTNSGPGFQRRLAVRIDYDQPFPGSEHAVWESEYLACVSEPPPRQAVELDEFDEAWWYRGDERPELSELSEVTA